MSDRDIIGTLTNEPSITGQFEPDITIRGSMEARFPANVDVISPLLLDRTGGTYTFSFDANSLEGTFASAAQGALADTAVQSVVAGSNVTVDNTDPRNPVVSASGGGGTGTVETIVAGTNITVDDTDPANPIVSSTAGSIDESADYDWTGQHTFAKTIDVNPASGSLVKGLDIEQTPHGVSSSGASIAYNLINIPSDDADTDGIAGGNSALKITHNFGGSSMKGQRIAILAQSFLTEASSASNSAKEYVGIVSQIAALSADGGTDTSSGARGSIFGGNFYVRASGDATNLFGVVGGEVNVHMEAGSTAQRKIGWQIVATSDDKVQGALYDSALSISSQTGAVGWNDGILFSAANGLFPIKSNGNVLRTVGGAVNNGIDLSGTTISTSAFKSTNFNVDGSGNISAPNISLSGGAVTALIVAGASASSSLVLESTTGAGTSDSIVFKTGSQATRWTIDTNGNLIGAATTAASSSSTGALRTSGGLGVSGKIYSGGDIVSGGAVVPGPGSFALNSAQFYYDNNLGTVLTAKPGISYDWGIYGAGGQELFVNPTGGANLKFGGGGGTIGFGSGAFAANGSVATVLGSLGPTGSHTTVQKWFKINDGTNTYYIPAF